MLSKLVLWGIAFTGVAVGASHLGSLAAPSATTTASPTDTSHADQLPKFQFRQLHIGVPLKTVRSTAGLEQCHVGGGTDTTCSLASWKVGSVPLTDSYVTFSPKGLKGLILVTGTDYFDDLASEMTSAYGTPCDASTRKLQNLMGASFAGDVLTWCFADGIMTLERHDKSNVRESTLTFYVPEPEAPKKNFSPSTL